jgi:ribonuclease R
VRVARTHGFIREYGSDTEYFVSGRDLCGAIPGDTVMFRQTAPARDESSKEEARVIRVLKSSENHLTGTIVVEDGEFSLIPDSFGAKHPLEIGSQQGHKLAAGDKVSFSLTERGKKHHHHVAEVTGVYGSSQSARVCVNAYLEEKGIPAAFSAGAEEEARSAAEEIDPAEIPHRLDLRGAAIFTIDGADTKDIDDAVSIEKSETGGYRLGVHIADVSHYVTADSRLDEEAFDRGTSVYIADLVVPMLPKALSNGICSLNPNTERLAFSCLMEVEKSGELKSFEFRKSVIRSRVQGVYSEINSLLTGNSEFGGKYAEVAEQLPLMAELAATLKKNREGRNAPVLESAESKIICDGEGNCLDIIRRESGVSEGIIEEFMLLANNAAARLAMQNELPFVYRVHEPPAAEKLTRLTETLTGLGIAVPVLKPTAESLSGVLRAAQKLDESKTDVVNMAVLRTMMKAKYADEPLGHFGLVMSEYAHFTSPIRRYPDLSIHRILSDFVAGKKIRSSMGKFAHESALKSTAAELRAVNAERDCNGFYAAEYMRSRIGEEFDGIIAGVTEMSVFVMLENTIEGRVSFRAGAEPLEGFSCDGVSLSNSVTGVRYTLGDRVRVKCVGCSVPLGMVDFEIV